MNAWQRLDPVQTSRRWRFRAALLTLGATGAALAAHAQQAPASRTLTLKEAVSLAARNSRDVELARFQYSVAQREAAVTRSAFLPNFYSGTGAAYTNGFPLLAGGGIPAIFTLTYDQQIFNPPLKGDQHAAEEKAEEQRLAMETVRDGVMVRAALYYLELAKVRHALELMRGEKTSADAILQAMRERVEAGRELPIEVTRAQLTGARVDQRIAQLEDREDFLSGSLDNMMGFPDDMPIEVSAEELAAPATDRVNDLIAQAMANNNDLKQAEAEQRASTDKLKGERGGYWPTFALTGQYNVLSRINHYDEFFNKFQRNNFVAGVEVRIPIFASRTASAVSFAKADLNAANVAVQKKRDELSLDVRRKARQVHEADLGSDVARLELQLAQDNLGVLQAQFDQGRGALKDLEAAHIEENDKWLAYLDANYAHQQAELELLRTTGQLSAALQ